MFDKEMIDGRFVKSVTCKIRSVRWFARQRDSFFSHDINGNEVNQFISNKNIINTNLIFEMIVCFFLIWVCGNFKK